MSILPATPAHRKTIALGEDALVTAVLGLLALLPCVGICARAFAVSGIRGSADYIRHLVLWVAFLGGMITAREGRHLSLTIGYDRLPPAGKRICDALVAGVDGLFGGLLAASSFMYDLQAFAGQTAGVFPIWLLGLIMPVGFALMTVRLIRTSATTRAALWIGIVAGLVGLAAGLAQGISGSLPPFAGVLYLPLICVLVCAALLGAPIFLLLGGLAALFFLQSGSPTQTIVDQAYTCSPPAPSFRRSPFSRWPVTSSRKARRGSAW